MTYMITYTNNKLIINLIFLNYNKIYWEEYEKILLKVFNIYINNKLINFVLNNIIIL